MLPLPIERDMGEAKKEANVIENLRSVVFKESESLEGTHAKIQGYDFNHGINYSELLKSLVTTGFQASILGDAIETVNKMLDWRLSHEQVTEDCSQEEKNPTYRESVRCKIFLGITSNLISSGVRDIIQYLVQHHMVLLEKFISLRVLLVKMHTRCSMKCPKVIGALASALANASPTEQRTMLGENLYPLVEQVEPEAAAKVTGMLLEMDQTEVLHLLESPEALKAKVAEAMEVLRNVSQQQQQSGGAANQLAALSLNDGIVS